MAEPDPTPEPEPEVEPEPEPKKRWEWKLFKRAPREPYVEFDERGQPERSGATTLGSPQTPPASPYRYASVHDPYYAPSHDPLTRTAMDLLALQGYRGASAHHSLRATMGMERDPLYWSGLDFPMLSAPSPPPPDPPKPGTIYR